MILGVGNLGETARPSLAMALFEMTAWPEIQKKLDVSGRRAFYRHYVDWVKRTFA